MRLTCSSYPVQATAAVIRISPAGPMEMTVQCSPHRSRALATVA
jgi:hypothetical protein